MLHRISALLLLAALGFTCLPASRAREDDEPTLGGEKLSYWIKQLQEGKDAKARIRGVRAVELIGYAKSKKVMPALVTALREDKEPTVRAVAARAVGRTAAKALEEARAEKKDELPRFDTVRDALSTALRSEKFEAVREAAALGLGEMGPDARGTVGALAQALKDKHVGTMKAAAQTLRRMGKEARDAQPELQAVLADKKADVEARIDAAVCLGQIRPDVSLALAVMRETLADDKADARIRKALADALGKLGKEAVEATPALAAVLVAKESPPELRLAAVGAIDQFGADAKAAIPALVKAVGDAALIKAMGDDARFIRCLAMQSLGRMGKDLDKDRKEAVAALLKAMDDVSLEVCVSAIETLGALGGDGLGSEVGEVVKRLDALLLREGRKSIREATQATLDKIKGKK